MSVLEFDLSCAASTSRLEALILVGTRLFSKTNPMLLTMKILLVSLTLTVYYM